MEERLAQLFPDQIVQVKEYHSFINQPERIQISSQEDISDYDANTITTYYNFRVRLPRPALNVKSVQLARASIPQCVPNIPDTETTLWYYALPQVSPGNVYADNAGSPGALAYTFDENGILYSGATRVRSGIIYNAIDGQPGAVLYTFDLNGVLSDIYGPIVGSSIDFTTGVITNPQGDPQTVSYNVELENSPFYTPIPLVNGGVVFGFISFSANGVFFDSGVLAIDSNVNGPFTFPIDPVPTAPTACDSGGTTYFWIEYTNPITANTQLSYLRYIRLVPSIAQPELMDAFAGGFNRTFQDYPDLLTEINNATVDDPLNGEASNSQLGTFKFIPNQVGFSYSDRFNKFVFTGLDTRFRYLPAASDDPNIWIAAPMLQERDAQNTRFAFTGTIKFEQPYQIYRDLNLRLGFTYITYPTGQDFLNLVRPIPPFIASPPNLGAFTPYDHVAPGYCDLVYSSCCHIYTDITGGSTVDSIAEKSLLATIPLNTANLGVGFHSLPLNNPLTKIASQIYEIYIELRTDSGQPFYLGNNAIVSLELILTY